MKNKNTAEIVKRLKKTYPDVKIALNYTTPFELLTATILSAQCTDERVNIVTSKLFKKYKKISDYANVKQEIFEQDIRSTGFFRNKAKNIIASANMVLDEYNGKVPDTMEDILKLPGVARKTANIVLGHIYGVLDGIAVDTHVKRIAGLLGLTKNTVPEKIEQDLMKLVDRKDWMVFSHLVQTLGRRICIARRPRCAECVLSDICPSSKVH